MFNCNLLERRLNFFVWIESNLVHKVVQSLIIEQAFYFGEHCLDWIEFWTVSDIPDRFHVQLRPPLFNTRLFVNTRIVHEKWNRFLPHLSAKLFEIVSEVFSLTCIVMDHDESNPVFFRHTSHNWTESNVNIFLIDSQVAVFLWPLTKFDWSFRKQDFIDIDDQSFFLFGLINIFN